MIKIDFEMTDSTGVNSYRDALYLEDDHNFTEEEIQAMKQARFDKWFAIILGTNATEVVPVEQAIDTPIEDVGI